MKKYDVVLALACTEDEGKLAFARMIIDMMEVDELYEPLKYNGPFEDLKELGEARYFEILGIDYEEREELERALKIWETRDLHDRLFKWLKAKNLPQPEISSGDKVYYREIAVGWKRLGMGYHSGELISKWRLFKGGLKKELSRQKPYGYGALKPGLLKFVDYVAIIGDIAWIMEGKQKLNPESIRQIMEYYDLFIEDNPTFEVRKAIMCEETNLEHERTCRENNIEVFSLR